MAVVAITTSLYTLTGCQAHEGSEEQLENNLDSFATYYYNWQFPKAVKFCTASSEPWLKYAASNVHEADVELLRNKETDATVEINDIDFGDDEVSAIADITVRNFLQMDSIGEEAHLVEEADFLLPMCMEMGYGRLEWQAYRKVEREITTELWMNNRPMLISTLIGRINRLHTHIQT